jgi:hypothetical protein
MTKLIVAFRNFTNAHENAISYGPFGYVKLIIQYKGHRIACVNYVSRTVFVCCNQCVPQKMQEVT